MSYELIETVELTSSAASIEFTSIPQDGTDLVVKVSARVNIFGPATALFLQLNNDTSANYSDLTLNGNGSSALNFSQTGQTENLLRFFAQGNNTTANTFGNVEIMLSNYTSSSAKSISADGVTENNATEAYQGLSAASYAGTSPISSLKIFSGQDFMQYSTASLYKITAA